MEVPKKTITDLLKSVQTTTAPTGVNVIQNRTTDCKERIRNFLRRVQTNFSAMVAGAEKVLAEIVPVALQFVQGLKTVVDSPAIDIIDALIPSRIPAEVVAQLRTHLGTVIDLLQLQLTCGKEASLEDKIACYLQYLRTCSPYMRDAIYQKTAAMLTHLMAGKHEFTSAEVDTMVQLGYVQLKHAA